jgi:hypothetical protein
MPEKHHHGHEHQWHDPSLKEWIVIAVLFIMCVAAATGIWHWFESVTAIPPEQTTVQTPFRQHQVLTGGQSNGTEGP